jgi:hypothetical protein
MLRSAPSKKCGNYKMLPLYDMQGHLTKDGFISNYLVWHDHREVEPPAVTPESDGNKDVDRMYDMIADTRREYDLDYEERLSPPEVYNFYILLATSDKKVHAVHM